MTRIIPSIAWSIMAAIVLCAAGGAAAEPFTNAPPAGSLDGSPRYLRHDETRIRPLEPVTQTAAAQPPAAPLPRPAEQQAWGASEVESERPAARPADKPALLLPPPTTNSRGRPAIGEPPALLTGAASLGIVLGLFLVVAWAVRRGMPRGSALLPNEVLEVLGRAPLAGKQQIHLLRCGTKLLLVCVSPTSVETLTEIADSDEVQRLTDLCQLGTAPANSFRKVFEQFSLAPVRPRYFTQPQANEPDFGSMAVELHHPHGGAG
ncbi:MAG TPA: flagellar biosynthetic protein FliO [Pirellulales bacterium]|nr:flagellar biosynthetic protein FliO [Pirellulales bacterium]